MCYHHYHRRPRLRQEVGLNRRTTFLSAGAQECVITIIIAVVVIVKRWGLNRRTLLSVEVPEFLLTIIIVVVVKRWGVKRGGRVL